jgi:hypothetical protein
MPPDATPAGAPSSTSQRILAAARAAIGADATQTACSVALAAAAKVSPKTAEFALRGRHVRIDVARKLSTALKEWGVDIKPGELAEGDGA